ncbi:MAG: hypothetical protein ACD_49C00067G0044 [uncultured bacterium (gcode 4)]|uniref:R3H domain-containing protein n=1 Tax=uncultured bacterium (gcode 4) TaxID=1234023 RepID=K2BBC5_9BACT|nr:MAG: hypothetical protein ACD_49C00067G0044 [uncultured bacterium (gcode 4)]
MKEQIYDLCYKFFTLSKIQVDSLSVELEDEKRNIYYVKLETPDSKLIIWIHGQSLDNIKHLLGRMIEGIVWKNCVIHLEVNDYLKSKDDKLYKYIDSRIDYITKNNKEITLPNFTSYERKKIHSYIWDKKIEWLTAWSDWVWAERVMHISYSKPKTVNIDIDIDWIDI